MPPTDNVPQLVDHLFRHTAGQMVATLTRILGAHQLQLAEDMVQEVLITALRQWPIRGVPDNPRAWLLRAARNRALDVLRREQRFADRAHLLRDELPPDRAEDLLNDDQLTMLLLCCHPALTRESQIALTLKTVGGLDVAEIASALLVPTPTIAQRLVRAKRTLRALPAPFALDDQTTLAPRRSVLLMTIYLIFNEGYSSQRAQPVRYELIDEALRLGELVAAHPATAAPETHALLALLWLSAARAATRVDDTGGLLLLEEQDRNQWDRVAIGRGMWHLVRAATGAQISVYHLQAGIAACHATAASIEETDWRAILAYYDQLLHLEPSPVVALNRAVAIAQLHGPDAGLAALAPLRGNPRLAQYPLLLATSGVLHARRGDRTQAIADLQAAAAQTSAPALLHLIVRRLAAIVGA